jgi:hypothetical protein
MRFSPHLRATRTPCRARHANELRSRPVQAEACTRSRAACGHPRLDDDAPPRAPGRPPGRAGGPAAARRAAGRYTGHRLVLAARPAGADGVVDKAEPVQRLLAAIRAGAADRRAPASCTQRAARRPVTALLIASSRKRTRTLAGAVSDGAALVLPAGHLLAFVVAPAGGERRVRSRRAAVVASTHRDPYLLDEWGMSSRSLHASSLTRWRRGAMECDAHLRSVP